MRMKKISAVLLAFALSFSGALSVHADTVKYSDVKKNILLESDGKYSSELDINGDGKVNVFDLCRTKAEAIESLSEKPPVSSEFSEENLYNKMIAFKEKYPDGSPWTNGDVYSWNGGIYGRGFGCAGFAFMLSDAAFGTLPARRIYEADVSEIRVGDIIRMNYDTHSVIVLKVTDSGFVLAEGNYNGVVCWGREVTFDEVKESLTYIMTRYPE